MLELLENSLRGLRTREGWTVYNTHADDWAVTGLLGGGDTPLCVQLLRQHGERVFWAHVAEQLDRPLAFYSRRERMRVGRQVWRNLIDRVLREGRAPDDGSHQLHLCVQHEGQPWTVLRACWMDEDGNEVAPPPCAPQPCMLVPLQT